MTKDEALALKVGDEVSICHMGTWLTARVDGPPTRGGDPLFLPLSWPGCLDGYAAGSQRGIWQSKWERDIRPITKPEGSMLDGKMVAIKPLGIASHGPTPERVGVAFGLGVPKAFDSFAAKVDAASRDVAKVVAGNISAAEVERFTEWKTPIQIETVSKVEHNEALAKADAHLQAVLADGNAAIAKRDAIITEMTATLHALQPQKAPSSLAANLMLVASESRTGR
jgi:hypothetical protein